MYKRNTGLDLLRIISTIAVIVIHVNAIWMNTGHEKELITIYIESLLNLLMRFSVPCFIMISGAYILANDKNEEAKEFYKRAFWKLGIPYIGMIGFWLVYYFWQDVIIQKDIVEFVKKMAGGGYGNLWFMPMLIALYTITPLLIKIIKLINLRQLKMIGFALIVWAIVSNSTSAYKLPYSIGVVVSYMGYYILGYILSKVSFAWSLKKIIGGGGVFSVILLFVAFVIRNLGFQLYVTNPFTTFFSPAVVIYSCYLFLLFLNICINFNLKWLSEQTYIVYLLHTPVIMWLKNFVYVENELLTIMLLSVATILCTLLLSIVYRGICDFVRIKIQKSWLAIVQSNKKCI